jgi:hypothetical protein
MDAMKDPIIQHLHNHRPKMIHDVATACGISYEAVYQWIRVPRKRVETVAKVTGLPASFIRPDLFGVATDNIVKAE